MQVRGRVLDVTESKGIVDIGLRPALLEGLPADPEPQLPDKRAAKSAGKGAAKGGKRTAAAADPTAALGALTVGKRLKAEASPAPAPPYIPGWLKSKSYRISNLQVEMVRPNHLVVSLPALGRAIAFVQLGDYNTARGLADMAAQFSIGQSIAAQARMSPWRASRVQAATRSRPRPPPFRSPPSRATKTGAVCC